jgi:peptide/nickel transport system substrate-binding protein
MKRSLFVVSALLLITAMLFTACAPAAAPTEAEEPAAEAPPAEASPEEEPDAEEAAPAEPPAEEAPAEEPAETGVIEGGTFRLQISEEPDTLDPHKSSAAVSAGILRNVGDPLIRKGLDNNYEPGLAREWSVSEDGLTWTFILRDDVTFHDGTPFNAQAMVSTLERAIAPETASPIAGSLLGQVDKIEIVDDYTFTIALLAPNADFEENLTDTGRLLAISPAALEEYGDEIGRHPVSTGPFMFKEWVSASSITLIRNPDYNWGPSFVHQGPVYLDELVYNIITETATAQATFENGELEALGLAPADIQWMMDLGEYEFLTYDRKGVGFFMEFNVTKAPFDDIKVREAFNYAVDKESVVDIALEGFGKVAYGPLPPTIRGYWEGVEDYAPGYDPQRAAALLDEAGWVLNETSGLREKDGQPFVFSVYTAPIDTWTASLQLIQDDLAALGITMDIQPFEFGTLLEKLMAGEHSVDVMGYTYLTPGIFDLWFHSKNIGTGLAHSHYNNPEFDAMIEQSLVMTDWEERQALLIDMQKLVIDQYLWVPIWNNTYYYALQPWVKDTTMHPDAYLILNDTWLEQ